MTDKFGVDPAVYVIIPWQETDESDIRHAALGFVRDKWITHFNIEPTLGVLSADSDWCKADAVELGIRASGAGSNDLLVIADADVWVDPEAIRAAIVEVDVGGVRWALPHRLVHRLTEEGTRLVLEGLSFESAVDQFGYDREPYQGTVGGGMTIIDYDDYRSVPLDPRFVGWGQEDESWGDALRTMFQGRHRGMADMWHLWHPRMPRMAPGMGNVAGIHLRRRYATTRGHQDRMRRLIDSGREYLID